MTANITVIPEDYDGLKKEYIILRKELDDIKQELYGSKRQIQILEALQLDYQNEIEILQHNEDSGKQDLEEKITQLEEYNNNLRLKYNERVQILEVDIEKQEEKNEILQAEVELWKKRNVSLGLGENTSKLLEEIANLKEDKEVLFDTYEEMKLSLETLQQTNIALEETLVEYKHELLELKESLNCKRDELLEANNLVQKLNEEIIVLKSELETYKSRPLDKSSKGNSLFAEVDDRRVYLQKTISNMKAEFIAMKQEKSKYLSTIHHLKIENKMLLDKWKSDVSEKEDDQYTILKSYKDRIGILENLIETYKKDLESKPVLFSTGSFEEFEFYKIMLDNKSKQMEELRNELASRSLTETLLSNSLREANEEKRRWRLEATLKGYQLEMKNEGGITENIKIEGDITEIEKINKKEFSSNLAKHSDNSKQCFTITDDINSIRAETKPIYQIKPDPKRAAANERTDEKCNDITKYKANEIITIDVSEDELDESINNGGNNDKSEETLELNQYNNITNDRNKCKNTSLIETGENLRKEIKKTSEINPKVEASKKNQTEESKENLLEEDLCSSNKNQDLKENIPNNVMLSDENEKNDSGKKVTFSDNTVSPKKTSRTGLRTCKKVIIAKPIRFVSIAKPQ